MSFPLGEPFPLYLTYTQADPETSFMNIWGQTDKEVVYYVEAKLYEWEPAFNGGTCCVPANEISIGQIYCAKFSEDQKWYRGRVLGHSLRANHLDVYFIDFGNTESIYVDDLRKVDASLYAIEPQAHLFVLGNIVPSDINWSIDALDLCRQFVYEEDVQAMVIGFSGDMPAIKITKKGSIRSLNDTLIDRGLAVQHIMLPTPNTKSLKCQAVAKTNTKSISQIRETDSIMDGVGYDYSEMHVGNDYDVTVVHVENGHFFWINVLEHRLVVSYDKMETDLALHGKSLSRTKSCTPIEMGMMCITDNLPKRKFGRGLVVGVHDDVADVFFVDFGNTESMSKSKIYPLPKVKAFEVTALAIKCTLSRPSKDSELVDIANTLDRLSKGRVVKCHVDSLQCNLFSVKLYNEHGDIFERFKSLRYADNPLEVEQFYMVNVSNISDPLSFHVHTNDRKESYEQLDEEIQEEYHFFYRERCLNFDHLPPGTPCAVRCRESSRWFRCRVEIGINKNLIKVSYVDTGRSQIVDPDQLYEITKEKVESLPPRAISCLLFQFTFSTEVAKKATDEFIEMVGGKNLTMQVVENKKSYYVVQLIDETSTPKRHINMLLSYRLKKKLQGVSIKPPILEKVESIFITSFVTPSLFFGQMNKFSMEALASMSNEIDRYYGPLKSDEKLICDDNLSHVGMYCCAPFTLDKKYYRAKILNQVGYKVTVLFIDFGNQEVVEACDVKELHEQFAVLPAFGIQCSIGNTFSRGLGDFRDSIKNVLLDNTIEVEIFDPIDAVYDVSITDSKDNMEILNKLKMCGIERRKPEDRLKIVPFAAPSLLEMVPTRFKDSPSIGDFKGGKITLTYVISPLEFWFTILEEGPNKVSDMLAELESIPQKVDDKIEVDVRIGQPCLSWYEEGWYRAEITQVYSPVEVEVSYVDYGNDLVVPVKSLRRIPSSMMKIPKQAIKSRLANIVETKFDSVLLNTFENSTLNEIFMAKPHITNSTPNVCSLELFDSNGTNLAECFKLTTVRPAPTISALSTICDDDWHVDDSVSAFDSVSVVAAQAACRPSNVVVDASDDWVESVGVPNEYENTLQNHNAQNIWDNSGASNQRSNRDGGSWKPKDNNGWSSQNRDSGTHRDAGDFQVAHDTDRGYSRFIPPRMQRNGSTDAAAPSDRWSKDRNENSNNFERNSRNFDSRRDNDFDRSASREERKPRHFDSHSGNGSDHSSSRDERRPRRYESQNGHRSAHFVPKEELALKDVEILCGSETLKSVRVCYVVSPSEFYCQLLEIEPQFSSMNEKLQSYYGGSGFLKSLNSYNSKTGAACCAKYSVDDQWYRAKIEKIDGGDASIHFVDYGNSEVMPQMELKVLEAQFYNVPKLALKCSLDDVRPPGGGDWTDDEMTAFEARVLDKVFIARIVSRGADGKYGVHLHSSIAVESSINYELIREKFVLPFDPNNSFYKRILSDAVASPFVETKLTIGQKEKVSISWVTSLGLFYCQLSSRKEELEKLEADLMAAFCDPSSGVDLSLLNLEVGTACVALYTETNYSAFCRAVILNIEVDHVYVHYVDYGNVGYIPKKDLRMILPDFNDVPMQAIKCRLFGVKPLTEEWPMLEGDQLKEFFKGSSVELIFRATGAETNLVELLIDDESVADKLVDAGLLAQQVATDVVISEVHVESEELTDGFHEIEICHVHSPQMFWCRLTTCTAVVNEISEELRMSELLDLSCPTIGLVVVCERKDVNLFCRAIIIERLAPNEFKVFFVDFGDVSVVRFDEMKLCSSKFARRSHLAVLCTLTGFTTESEQTANDVFASEVVFGRRLTAHVDGNSLGVYSVTLFAVGGGITNLNLQMGLESSVEYVHHEASSAVSTVDLVAEKDQEFVDSEEKLAVGSTTQFAPAGEKVDVILTSILSPKSFWVQKTSDVGEISALSDRLNAEYADTYADDLDATKWIPGSLCVGLYSLDHMWYRARIVSGSEDSLTVIFIDYGNEETLPFVNVRRISSEFSSVLPFAVHCTLDVLSELDISENSLNAFQEEVGYGEEVLKAEFLRHDGNQSVIKLFDCSGNDLVDVLNLNDGSRETAAVEDTETEEFESVTTAVEGLEVFLVEEDAATGVLNESSEAEARAAEYCEVEEIETDKSDSSGIEEDGFGDDTSEKEVLNKTDLEEQDEIEDDVSITETDVEAACITPETKEIDELEETGSTEVVDETSDESSDAIEADSEVIFTASGEEEVFEDVVSEVESTVEGNVSVHFTQPKEMYEEEIDVTARQTNDLTEQNKMEEKEKTSAIEGSEVAAVIADISTDSDSNFERDETTHAKEEVICSAESQKVSLVNEEEPVEEVALTETEVEETKGESFGLDETVMIVAREEVVVTTSDANVEISDVSVVVSNFKEVVLQQEISSGEVEEKLN